MKGHIWGEDTLNTNGFVNGPTFSQEILSIMSNIKPRTKYNEYISVTMQNGIHGSFCYKTHPTTPYWDCQDSSDYTYIAVVDDFGNLQQVGCATNIRGY